TTRALVPPAQRGRGTLLAKQDGVVCGLAVAREAFAQLSPALELEALRADGEAVRAGERVAVVRGPLAPMLSAERVALNLLQRLSGIATLTRRYVEAACAGGPAEVLDTRKTTPGLRDLERYAVRAGGGRNHRNTLEDGVLIKDNHIAAGARRGVSVAALVAQARALAPHTLRVEVEADDVATALAAVAAGADVVLLDNMNAAQLRAAVAACARPGVLFEASGGVTLQTVGEIAASGVHFVSVGALTHSAPALDISLDVEVVEVEGEAEHGAGRA
ncbi:MAG: carboxylating nicotinate-nucleotide diphosphorylase, partial [Dehalococcoidia bacterium]|nr:carboxylating nicotinate-nucleotide diphosphorylase [Dehalococcoidia bacterium]